MWSVPGHQSLTTLPEAFGAEISSIQLQPEQQWRLDLEQVERAFRKNTKLLVLNYPHNPTGALLERELFDGLIELARKNGAYIFCDEVYRYLELDERRRLPSLADAYEKGIALNVMTKSFGLAGLRISWLATQDPHFLKEVGSYKLYNSICNSAPSEILALIALRAKERLLKRNREILLNNFEILKAFMQRNQKTVSWIPPEGGTMAILKLLLPLSVDTFAEDLVQQEGVLIMPGSVFNLSGNYFRIGFGKKNMPPILEKFEKYLCAF